MASLDQLPADERAALQLVLQQGRSYDQIAQLLGIDRAAVRQRALSALDVLGPETRVAPERRALITDYLLGQLPERVSDQVRERLRESASERAWARVVSAELAPIARASMPEIPVEAAHHADEAAHHADEATASPATAITPGPSPAPASAGEPVPASFSPSGAGAGPARRGARARRPPATAPAGAGAPGAPAARSSRTGGILLLALAAAAVVIILLNVLGSGGSSGTSSAPAPVAPRTTASGAAPSTTSPTTSTTAPHIVAQVNLIAPSGAKNPQGVVEVLSAQGRTGVAIVASGLQPNSIKPPDAYAVWLYNSASDSHLLGFVRPGVGKNGRLSTAGGLPAHAGRYRQIVIALEHTSKPSSPGRIVLAGTLKGVSS